MCLSFDPRIGSNRHKFKTPLLLSKIVVSWTSGSCIQALWRGSKKGFSRRGFGVFRGHSVAGIHCKGVIETFIPGCNSDRLLQNLILDASENAFILPSRAIRQYRSTHVSSRQTWVDELSRFESVSVGWKSELAIGVLTTRADGWCRYCTKSLEKTTSKVQSSATLNFFSSRGSLSR